MLENKDKHKIEQYIDKLIKGIWNDTQNSINTGMPEKQVIDKVINATVNKFAPESKMILSSVYNMMMERTLQEPVFDVSKNKASFYEMNILKELNGKFDFNIPKVINYEESKATVNKWMVSGAVVAVGGAISISLKNWIPVCIALIIASIMVFLLKDKNNDNSKTIATLINEYLDNVKKSLLLWVDAIEQYYDERVDQLRERLAK